MTTLIDKAQTQSGVEIAGIINLPNDTIIEVYGEIHGQDNAFCKKLITNHILLPSLRVLCEHATVLCHVNEHDYNLIETVTGSDYIFFNLMKEGVNKPICFDNRIENGLPSAIEEHAFVSFFEDETFSRDKLAELRLILVRLNQIKNKLDEANRVFIKVFEKEYLSIMSTINTQFEILNKSVQRGLRFINGKNFFLDGIANHLIVLRVGFYLTNNISKLCSAFVDINTLILIGKQPDHSHIVVFTGASHAYRLLTKIFKKHATLTISPSNDLLPSLHFTPEGMPDKEADFLEKLS
jgi:hypothetical protein